MANRGIKGDPQPQPLLNNYGEQRTKKVDGRVVRGWRLRFKVEGRPRVQKTFYGSLTQASRELGRLIEETESSLPSKVTNKRISLNKYLADWVASYKYDANGQPRKRTTYREHLTNYERYIQPYLKAHKLDKKAIGTWTPDDVKSLINEFVLKSGREPSESMKRSVTKTLRMALKQAVDQGLIGKSPMETFSATWVPKEVSADEFTPTPDQMEVVAQILESQPRLSKGTRSGPPRDYLGNMLRVLYWTGLRPAEALGLELANIDFDERHIIVNTQRTVSGGRTRANVNLKSRASRRVVPILDEAFPPLVSLYQRAYTNSDYLFMGEGRRASRLHNGERVTVRKPEAIGYSMLSSELRAACATAVDKGLIPEPFTLHVCRHGFATTLLSWGVPEEKVAKWMGHTSSAVTKTIYAPVMVPVNLTSDAEMVKALAEAARASGGGVTSLLRTQAAHSQGKQKGFEHLVARVREIAANSEARQQRDQILEELRAGASE